MKTRFIFISVLCLATLVISSCTRQSLREVSSQKGSEKRNRLDGEGSTSPYFFTDILKVKGLEIKESTGNGYDFGESERTALFLLLYGNSYNQFFEATSAEFKKLAGVIGDVPKKEGYRHGTPTDNQTIESSISDISVKTLTGYDEAHPLGSSLKDIIRLRFESFDYVFDKTLKPTNIEDASYGNYLIKPEEPFTPIKYPTFRESGYRGEKEYVYGLVMSIEFTQKPSNPSQQIEVTLSFANGLVLSKEIAVQIKEQ